MRSILSLSLVATLMVVAFSNSTALALTFVEADGFVMGEAEDFTRRTANGVTEWTIVPDEVAPGDANVNITSARQGRYIQLLADDNMGSGGPTNAPSVEYDVTINTTGTYRLFTRWTADQPTGNSDSMFVDIVQIKDGGGGEPDWYELSGTNNNDFRTNPGWDGSGGAEQNQAGASNNPVVWDITAPGVYTIRFSEREDGAAVDAWVLQLDSIAAPTLNGPTDPAAGNQTDAFLYYTFSDSADGIVDDFSGNGRAANLQTFGANAAGYDNSASPVGAPSLAFDEGGTSSGGDVARLSVSAIPTADLDFSNDSWTISTWFNRSADSNDEDFIVHLGNGDGFGGGNELYVRVSAAGDLVLQSFLDNANDLTLSGGPVSAGEWHNLALIHDANAGALSLLLDGQVVGQNTITGLNLNNSVLFGGHDSTTFQTSRYFDGNLDDIAIWARTLNATEIRALASGASALTLHIPEPTTALLGLMGLAGLATRRRRAA